CRQLNKSFGKVWVLKNVSLVIQKNEIFGILGLNGAGKTTLLKCILGFLSPTSGTILFYDKALVSCDVQQKFSYLPESFQLFRELTALELTEIFANTLGKSSVYAKEALSTVGLLSVAKRRIRTFSRGMQQRLGLALCLMKEPEVLILDDPFLGLDVAGQLSVIQILEKLKKKGTTIIFSSHTLAQVEKIVDSVAIIDQGEIIFSGTKESFLSSGQTQNLETAFLKVVRYEKNNWSCSA
ncbi:MAG: ABC transporter ATP-binding protein, partial [Candidatus Omnitrophica bacterium]|nr:ABC transporter ATP-binding protein [Candidatus Omnitrophota bacterium]